MGLPKIDVPTQTVTLPSTQKEITIRPFLVKEEKILLTALTSGETNDIIHATKQVVHNCIITRDVDVEKLPVYDLEYLILQLRIMSIGNTIKVQFSPIENTECEQCKKGREVEVDISEAKVVFDSTHENRIQLTKEIGIVLKDPSAKIMNVLGTTEKKEISDMFKIIWSCVDCVYDSESQTSAKDVSEKEGVDFLESLNTQQFAKIDNFFKTLPKLQLPIEIKCENCGFHDTYTLEKLESFFG
jgi:hypothetical protein